jgi:hypothetical protein
VLIQIITVDPGKRRLDDVRRLEARLVARGHDVICHRFSAAPGYMGRSADDNEIVEAIWRNDRVCFAHARQQQAEYTLVLEEDCEIDDLDGIEAAASFLAAHPDEVDLFFLGASPNCWWRRTADRRVVKYSHAYWWHAVIFTRSFIARFDGPRTWREPNDIHFSRLIGAGEVRAFGLRRQVAFQQDRRSWLAEHVLYRFPWGDGRRILVPTAASLFLWMWLRN